MSEIRHIRFTYDTMDNKTPESVVGLVQRAIGEIEARKEQYDFDWSTFEINTSTEWIDERSFAGDEEYSTPITVMEFSIEGVER